ncbi:MAG: ABC transporter permease [Lachnospiraceae bacterium]
MKSMIRKTTFREIRGSFGRYAAIMSIIALGVGFFSGLKVTKQAMWETTNQYLEKLNLFDYRLVSTLGLAEEDVDAVRDLEGVEYAEGAYYADATAVDKDKESVVRFHSWPKNLNGVSILTGRGPEKSGEIVLDGRYYTDDYIGTTITIPDTNSPEILDRFSRREYTVVGLGNASLYLNYERGSTTIGNGSIQYYCYILPEDFRMDYYTDIYVTMEEKHELYSAGYDGMIEAHQDEMEAVLAACGERRLREIYENALYQDAGAEPESGKLEPATYVLTRETNVGYVSFQRDSEIVEGIAVVFPIFFFLVAALVCMTTMNRMVEEQRTQIGVLKALGYGTGTIMGKYMTYSGSAALIGCVGGFFLGSWIFPATIWKVYGMMYGFTEIHFVMNWVLFAISLAVSLFCSIGTTWVSCRYELAGTAAELIRPKAPKAGKRIFLEYIPFIWKRLKFLYKVSIRNVVRYKKRFFMMVLGISGCTGLIVTGFGIQDSIVGIADAQYGTIMVYDESVSFIDPLTEEEMVSFAEDWSEETSLIMPVYQTSVDIIGEDTVKATTIVVPRDADRFPELVNLHTPQGEPIAFPGYGEVVLAVNTAEAFGLHTGDTVTMRTSDMKEVTLRVSAVCQNFFMSSAYLSAETYEGFFGSKPAYKTAFVNAAAGQDLYDLSTSFLQQENVSAVTVNEEVSSKFNRMMKTMDYIVVLIIACAAALAFIVLYNLTNINITERIREIATIKVLGFYPGETAIYVFRENMVLTAIGALVGLPLGIALQRFVMSRIKIDMVRFDVHIDGSSFLYAILFTFGFALIVDVVMYFKLKKINMAESLKSIE